MDVNAMSVERVVTSVLGGLSTNGVIDVTPEMTIKDDLGIDSVSFVFAVVQVQELLGLDFFGSGTKAAAVRTVGDFVATCHACAAREPAAATSDRQTG
jgi:acyl carrier protein